MAPRSDRDHTAVQRAAWDALWRILLTPRPDEGEGRQNDDTATGEVAAASGEGGHDDASVARHSSA